ncbi:MAG: thioredoxin family protein [Rhodothermia bacterium]
MKITIATILISLTVIGWRLYEFIPDPGTQSISARAPAHTTEGSTGPDWIPFESAIKEADSTGRPSMVFIYADWCQWCQKTFAETFTDETVLQYLKENYHAVKLNVDGPDAAIVMKEQTITEAQLSQILGATGLPTFVFLDRQGDPITKTMGYYDAESAMKLLTTVAEQ